MKTAKELEEYIKKITLMARIEERKFEWYRNMFCILLLVSPTFFFSTKVFGILYFSIISYMLFYDQRYIEKLEKQKNEARKRNQEKKKKEKGEE